MPDGLYERDALAWSEEQAELLRRLSRGDRVNHAVDWANLIEEVQDVGLSELRACKSLLRQAMTHLMKVASWPESQSVPNWIAEADVFLADAEDAFTPSMRQRVELDDLFGRALRSAATAADHSGGPLPLVQHCPWTLAELFAGDIGSLVAQLHPAPSIPNC